MKATFLFPIFCFLILSIPVPIFSQLLEPVKVFNKSYYALEDFYMNEPVIAVEESGEEYRMKIYDEDFQERKVLIPGQLVENATYITSINIKQKGDRYIRLTQTLFNDDDLFEFIVTGDNFFAVVNEIGEVLYRKDIEEGVRLSFSIAETKNKKYLCTYATRKDGDYSNHPDLPNTTYYLINKGVSGSSSPLLQKTSSFPNPAKEYIHLTYDLQGAFSGTLIVHDLQGKTVFRKTVTGTENSVLLDTSVLASGTYIISVEVDGTQISTEKIMVR